MKKFQKNIRRFLLFNKRLLKKPSFLAILLIIPVIVAAFSIISIKEDSGMVTVAIGREDNHDPIAMEITESLLNSNSLIHFIDCETSAEALDLVCKDSADAAWIFSDNLQSKIEKFANFTNKRNSFVRVVEKESNILLQISHEKLYTTIFPYCSYAKYENFVTSTVTELSSLTPEEIRDYYNSYAAEGENLFDMSYVDIDVDADSMKTSHYLLVPLRGLMAVMAAIGGLAVSMFYMQDKNSDKFDWLQPGRRALMAVGYHTTAVLDIAIVMLVTVFLSGLGLPFLRELGVMLLYVLMIVGFSIALQLICNNVNALGAFIPVLSIAMIALCPVFFNLVHIPALQLLLPPYYYLNAIYSNKYIIYMVIYIVVFFGFDALIYKIREK